MNIEDVKVLDQECGVTDPITSARVEISMWIILHKSEHRDERLCQLAGRVINEDSSFYKVNCLPTAPRIKRARDNHIKTKFRDLYSVLRKTTLVDNEDLKPLLEESGI